jgi:hypothetical protein
MLGWIIVAFSPECRPMEALRGENAGFPALFMHLGNLTASEPVLMLKAALGKQRANCETRMAGHRPG